MQEINTEIVRTKRLILRPFNLKDAKDVQRLANDKAISDGTHYLPYPYTLEIAKNWITSHRAACARGEQVIFAITLKRTKALVGTVGLFLNDEPELGYWIGRSYWGRGYATEAAQAMIEYAFNVVGVQSIFSDCFQWNTPSIKVIQKVGMTYRKTFDKYIEKRQRYEPVDQYEIKKPNK